MDFSSTNNTVFTSDVKFHTLVVFDGQTWSSFYNGIFVCYGYKNSGNIIADNWNQEITVGGWKTLNYHQLVGNIYRLIMQKENIVNANKYIMYDTNLNSLKFLEDTQVFIPPVYPNTIL